MLFQGKEFEESVVRESYEETMDIFKYYGLPIPSFEDWVEYNNDFYKDKKRAMKNLEKKLKK